MKFLSVVTVRIEPDIFALIDNGIKRFEVRLESFQHADIIRYQSADASRRTLPGMNGLWDYPLFRLGPEHSFARDSDPFVRSLAGVDERTFARLFPIGAGTGRLYVARIGESLMPCQIFDE